MEIHITLERLAQALQLLLQEEGLSGRVNRDQIQVLDGDGAHVQAPTIIIQLG